MQIALSAALLALVPCAQAKPAASRDKAAAAAAFATSTAPVTAADVVSRFETIDAQLSSLKARYRQSVTLEASGTVQAIEGRLSFLKPDHLRVEHSKTEKQTVVSDGKTIWVHRHSSNQVIQSDLADWKKADPLIHSLLDFGGYASLAKRYEVSYSSGTREATLTPKEKDAGYLLRLKLAPDTFFPVETELRLAQMRVRTWLDEIEFNPPLREVDFAFTPPPGADVFRNFKPPRLQQ